MQRLIKRIKTGRKLKLRPYRGRLREGAESYAKALASDILR